MADEKGTEATPPAETDKSDDGWSKLTNLVEGTVRKVVGEELGKWESKKTSTESSTNSTGATNPGPVEKGKTFLEKLISN